MAEREPLPSSINPFLHSQFLLTRPAVLQMDSMLNAAVVHRSRHPCLSPQQLVAWSVAALFLSHRYLHTSMPRLTCMLSALIQHAQPTHRLGSSSNVPSEPSSFSELISYTRCWHDRDELLKESNISFHQQDCCGRISICGLAPKPCACIFDFRRQRFALARGERRP